jgi:hypothetical protein
MKAQQRRGLNSDGNLWEAVGSAQEGTDAEQSPIPRREARGSVTRSVEDQQLMLQKQWRSRHERRRAGLAKPT